jgi:hypothetical protein
MPVIEGSRGNGTQNGYVYYWPEGLPSPVQIRYKRQYKLDEYFCAAINSEASGLDDILIS